MRSRTFRIFVSSTFSDLELERNALQKIVYPELKSFCRQHQAEFEAIDLRWGVSQDFGYRNRTMQVCLNELKRCQEISPRPNFIILLGNRYGWRPLPELVSEDEYKLLNLHLNPEQKSLFETWYELDSNNLAPAYFLKARPQEWHDPKKWFAEVEKPLREALYHAAKTAQFPDEKMITYAYSATHKEILDGALLPDAGEHVFCYLREMQGLPLNKNAQNFHDLIKVNAFQYKKDLDAQEWLGKLKSELNENILQENIFHKQVEWNTYKNADFSDYCNWLIDKLKNIISLELEKLDKIKREQREALEQKIIMEQKDQLFCGKQAEIEYLLKIIKAGLPGYKKFRNGIPVVEASNSKNNVNQDFSPPVIVLCGEAGSGKSALISQLLKQAFQSKQFFDEISGHDRLGATKSILYTNFIYRFIGNTPASSNGYDLLRSLIEEFAYDKPSSIEKMKIKELAENFKSKFTEGWSKTSVFILDGLDHLNQNDPIWRQNWLPEKAHRTTRLILTTSNGKTRDLIHQQIPEAEFIELDVLNEEEIEEFFNKRLIQSGRKVQPGQKEVLLEKARQNRLPYYLELLQQQALNWKSSSQILQGDIPDNAAELETSAITEFEKEHGIELVKFTFLYLNASGSGLTESEIQDLLSTKKEVMREYQHNYPYSPSLDRLPYIVWSRLYFDLQSFLINRGSRGGNVLNFKYPRFEETLKQKYGQNELRRLQLDLTAYFDKQPYHLSGGFNYRKIDMLPNLLLKIEQINQAAEAVLSMDYLEAQYQARGTTWLQEQLELIANQPGLDGTKKRTLILIKQAVFNSTNSLRQSPKFFRLQIQGRLKPYLNSKGTSDIDFDLINNLFTDKQQELRIIKSNLPPAGEKRMIDFSQVAPPETAPLIINGDRTLLVFNSTIRAFNLQTNDEIWNHIVFGKNFIKGKIVQTKTNQDQSKAFYLVTQPESRNRIPEKLYQINTSDGSKNQLLFSSENPIKLYEVSPNGDVLVCQINHIIGNNPYHKQTKISSAEIQVCQKTDYNERLSLNRSAALFEAQARIPIDHQKGIDALKFMPDNEHFLTLNVDELALWNCQSAKKVHAWKTLKHPESNLSANGQNLGRCEILITSDKKFAILLICSQLFKVTLGDFGEKMTLLEFDIKGQKRFNIKNPAICEEENMLLFELDQNGFHEIYQMDLQTWQVKMMMKIHTKNLFHEELTFSLSGKLFAAFVSQSYLCLHELEDLEFLENNFALPEQKANPVVFAKPFNLGSQPGKSLIVYENDCYEIVSNKNGNILSAGNFISKGTIKNVLLENHQEIHGVIEAYVTLLIQEKNSRHFLLIKGKLRNKNSDSRWEEIASAPATPGKLYLSADNQHILLHSNNELEYFSRTNLKHEGTALLRRPRANPSDIPRFNPNRSQQIGTPARKQYRDINPEDKKILPGVLLNDLHAPVHSMNGNWFIHSSSKYFNKKTHYEALFVEQEGDQTKRTSFLMLPVRIMHLALSYNDQFAVVIDEDHFLHLVRLDIANGRFEEKVKYYLEKPTLNCSVSNDGQIFVIDNDHKLLMLEYSQLAENFNVYQP